MSDDQSIFDEVGRKALTETGRSTIIWEIVPTCASVEV